MHTTNGLYIAILIVVVVLLLYLFPGTQECLRRAAPWIALIGGGLAIGYLLASGTEKGYRRAMVGGAVNDIEDDVFDFEVDKTVGAETEDLTAASEVDEVPYSLDDFIVDSA